MSSAALQAAPHQSSTITSLSPTASPSSRQYPTQQPQPRDPYYNQQTSNASPSTTSRRAGRKPSGNGASTNSQQQPSYQSPSGSAPASSTVNSRGPTMAAPNSPIASLPTGYPANEFQRGVAPVAPPRTSSHQKASGTDRQRRGQPVDDRLTTSARSAGVDGAESDRGNSGRQTNGNDRSREEAAANSASRSKRRQPQAAQDAVSPQGASTRESRSAPSAAVQSRSQGASSTSSPNGPSREASAVLNRVVVSKPEVDIEREQERMAEAQPSSGNADLTPVTGLSVVGSEGVEDTGRGDRRSRQDHTTSGKKEKNTRFGEYFLGNTLGEGEFGKVKMGWKQEGGVQVAIKLIRRDSVGTNPTRLAKIYREIAILREISHPNIVRLHEMVETEKHIGIILEYASGGELFDYILNHRYLKDNAARRLFAQLVSGVGYLHKKGIVHRDLKLENLLLDRNRNIIITDFGFANTFNPADELGEEVEYGLASRDYVKRMELDKILPGGHRRGDLMQTSCGSPCYAAPELVVSDSLYTGRKVDVWSCGVILYAMLAGYLPFDDDPANPEGDNINLLYKYIVSTPLTFPEYVTPHARDLLRRILVPDPRKRADLFEVARHSWLSEYSHVVGFITSSTTTSGDIANTTVGSEEVLEAPLLARSASVREPTKTSKPTATAVGDLSRKHGNVDQDAADAHPKTSKDNKRRTVQVEYVAPRSQTVRGEDAPVATASTSKTRARSGSQGPVEVAPPINRRVISTEKPLPQEPREGQYQTSTQTRAPSSSQRQQGMPPPSRPGREPPRAVSDNAYMTPMIGQSIARPNTGGSMTSTASGRGSLALHTRNSYGLPVAPVVAGTNAHGRMAQPKGGNNYNISSPLSDEDASDFGRPSVNRVPDKFARLSGFADGAEVPEPKANHKRSNTVSGLGEKLFGRRGSLFGGKSQAGQEKAEKPKKSYPPVSMQSGLANNPRQSMDSGRRSISFGLGRKRSGSIAGSGDGASTEKSRRFSLIPAGFSLKSIGIGKDSSNYDSQTDIRQDYDDPAESNPDFLDQPTIQGQGRHTEQPVNDAYNRNLDSPLQQDRRGTSTASPPQHNRYASQGQPYEAKMTGANPQYRARPGPQFSPPIPNQSDASLTYPIHGQAQAQPQQPARYPTGFNEYDGQDMRQPSSRQGRGVLQKNNRKFEDAYEQPNQDYSGNHNSAGSSGAARKVMDFFRRRGKAREGDDR